MTAIASADRAPAPQRRLTYRELVEEREHLIDLLADARDWARTLELVAVWIVVERRAERPHDVEAERRVLGALANGRAAICDVTDLEPVDFLGDGHAALFAALTRALRQEAAIGVRVRPSARRDPAMRAYVAAEVRRRAVGEALIHEGALAAWRVLQGLPRPAACPRRDVVRVEELARWRRGER